MYTPKNRILYLSQLALLVAIELVMKLVGLGSVPIGPLSMSFLTVPIAVAAILLGPFAGAVTGAVFGITAFYECVSGTSPLGLALLQLSVFHTFMLCVTMRILVGLCTAWIFRLVLGASKRKNLSFLVGAVAAPLTNTIFFMGYMVLFFYQTEAIQALASALHATNPLAFIVLLVGLQGVIEVVVSGIVSTLIVKVLSRLLAAQQEIR